MRLFSWNIHGIAPFLQTSVTEFFQVAKPTVSKNVTEIISPPFLRDFLHRHNWPAVLFLQEVKIAAKEVETQQAVRKAVNPKLTSEISKYTKGPTYEAHFTLATDLHNARGQGGKGKVYGVCSIIRSDLFLKFDAKVRSVDWDKEGRVSVVELRTSSTKLALFNIYAVNGTDDPYHNPSTGSIEGTRHGRKLAFHKALMGECLRLEEEGWHVMLAGDMNVTPYAADGHPRLRTFPRQHNVNRADFKAKFLGETSEGNEKGFDGVDVWRKTHGDERRYTYYPRYKEWGSLCNRVDHVIVGKKSWDEGLVKNAGIMDSEAERGPSDHVPIWVDFTMQNETDNTTT